MLVSHQVLQHGILVLDFIVDFLIKVAHSVVWILASDIIGIFEPFLFEKDV